MRAGMDEQTGKLITGWPHVVQNMRRCITTRPASLVLRRTIGSRLPALQDENMSAENVLRAYVAIIDALNPANPNHGEPNVRIRQMRVLELNESGQVGLALLADYYPNGHLGDFSQKEEVNTTLPLKEVA